MSCVRFGRTELLYTDFFVLTCLLMSSPGGCGDTEKDGSPATPFASARLVSDARVLQGYARSMVGWRCPRSRFGGWKQRTSG